MNVSQFFLNVFFMCLNPSQSHVHHVDPGLIGIRVVGEERRFTSVSDGGLGGSKSGRGTWRIKVREPDRVTSAL